MACEKPTDMVQALMRRHDTKWGGGETLQCGETPQEWGLGAPTYWSHDPDPFPESPNLRFQGVKWGYCPRWVVGSFEDQRGGERERSRLVSHGPVPKPRCLLQPHSLTVPALTCCRRCGLAAGGFPARPWTLEPSPEQPLFPETELEQGRPICLGLN